MSVNIDVGNKIYEVIGSGFSLEIKNYLRLGKDTTNKLKRMQKLLDNYYMKYLICEELYYEIFFRSIPTIIQKSATYIAGELINQLPSTLTNIRAIGLDDFSIQLNSSEDRNIENYLLSDQGSYEIIKTLFDEHIIRIKEFRSKLAQQKLETYLIHKFTQGFVIVGLDMTLEDYSEIKKEYLQDIKSQNGTTQLGTEQ